ncbi:P-loop containing nucleoside triphosphate hydrolase protein [Dendryphion nanum]|uniref:P-loop containing nucleoside triphosphate hydrolase protein n=1 Tax=Dendryphion nanum TaxID=256645 RepID=A0A9P9E1D3_9PLEO|nr:P-loop containing nucleoside triphosphate hydrolase protein [Dendryphion nanum]
MDDLENLELLSLVSKVTSEIQNHLGVSDKTLAEFVIAQHVESGGSVGSFQKQLASMGAEFPQSLVDSVDRLCLTLHPKYKKAIKGSNGQHDNAKSGDERSRVFRGLAIPDKEVEFEEQEDAPESSKLDALDDTFAMLEGLAGNGAAKPKQQPSSRKRSISPFDEDREKERSRSKRHRYRSESRSRSRSRSPRRSRNDEFLFEDEFGRTRTVKKDKREDRKSRRRYRDEEEFRRPPTPELDDEPVLYKVYDGKITGVKDFGVFVNLQGVKGKVDGLVHVTQMQEGARVNHPSDLVSRWQEVKVKVVKMEGGRLSLSMKEVDQVSGHDLAPHRRIGTGANSQGLGGANEVPVVEQGFNGRNNGMRKRMTSPERWEIKQLIASGVIPKSEYPDIDYDYDAVVRGETFEEEEDVDIEVREEEPPFLAGQTKQSLELSPIRVVKAPDGSMNRAAMAGDQLAKERRDLRTQEAQEKAAKEAAQVDLSSQWNDPMAKEKQFASDLRNARTNQSSEAMPEWKKIATGREASFGKRTSLSMKEQRETLPVFKFRQQLLDAVAEHQILIVVGETGSGKTTQMTQYLAEAGYANELMIGCTQPRRVAAMSVAKRVAEEVGCPLGAEVGYTIRFEDKTSPDTKIKYMTDGIAQREILLDPLMSKYSVMMLDEAHERTIATDVLFGLLKKTLKRRPDMKLIVTSATLAADTFSSYFNGAPIFSIPGRTFPVEVMYSREPESDYLDAALVTVMQIHLTEPPGDILLFLTGKEEIDSSCEVLSERMKALGPNVPELMILPIYGQLPSEIASKIFEPTPVGCRKVVIATNIAETSLTIGKLIFLFAVVYLS